MTFLVLPSNSATGYNLTKSLRFRSSASAYLNRTFGTPTLSTKWTWSGWLKFGYGSSYYTIFDGGSPDTRFGRDPSTNQLYVNNDTTNYIITTPVYRDYSAWYHAVLAFDSSQGTASNRLRLYINGSEVTAFATDNRSSISGAIGINTATAHGIGRQPSGGSAYFDGYMTEINFIDGQQLTPSSFGETSTSTSVWIPKKYTGTYGTNGFYLPFTDVATTSGSNAGLGKDFSGNGNYWTTNNISVTSGTTYDSMSDVPTLTSATTANYCVLNPIALGTTTLSDGNLKAVLSTTTSTTYSTVGVTTGKWYWEVTYLASTSNALSVGVNQMGNITTLGGSAGPLGTGGVGYYGFNGNKYVNGTGSSYGATFTTNDVIGVALDATGGTITFYKNNTSQGTISLPTLTSSWDAVFDNGSGGGTQTMAVNFGQQPFAYTPPTGFVALNTFNLPTPTIGATASTVANKYMDATLYTGAGNTSTSITNAGGFQPDFVWTKARSIGYSNYLYDAVRGTGTGASLVSNGTGAEGADASNANLSSFNSNGWTIGTTSGTNALNASGQTFVAWQWKANGSGSTNTSGSITSTVSANTTAGFSIVTYTGNGSASSQTVGHGLNVGLSMLIVKSRATGSNDNGWGVSHTSIASSNFMYLNDTGAATNYGPGQGQPYIGSGSTFSILAGSSGTNNFNGSGATYVAYCFSAVAGYSAFGSYTGNGSSDGPFVFCGFRPKYVMIKRSDSTASWYVQDSVRDTYNQTTNTLYPNLSAAEDQGYLNLDLLSNGFKIRTTTSNNASGGTYVYACFAESPFKYANAR